MEIQVYGVCSKKVTKKISIKRIPGYLEFSSKVPFSPKNPLYEKVNFILKRVLNILGLDPWSYKALEENLSIIIDRDLEKDGMYDRKTKEIFLKYRHLDEYVLAHELVHFILDHYFNTRMSRNMHEILAVYVDKNLKKSKLLWIHTLIGKG